MRKTKVQILNEILKKGKSTSKFKEFNVTFYKHPKIVDAISIEFRYADGTNDGDSFDAVPVDEFLSHNISYYYNRIYLI